MGRTGQPAVYLGVSSLLVIAAGSAVVLTRGDGPVSKAPTTVATVSHAQLISPTGVAVAARPGQRVPNGDVVRTGRNGAATLSTRGRTVYVGANAALAVMDGAHQQLRHGRAVVDAQHGPGLRVDLAGDSLVVPDGAAVEATRSVSVVVGVLAGSSQITNPSARRLTLPRLSQVALNGDALPTSTAPLHLRDDSIESQVAPALVSDDHRLQTLARGIDGSGAAAATVIESAWQGATANGSSTPTRSDRVLPMVIADATTAAGGTVQARYDHTVAWRRAGGSWGVVVELLDSHAGAVESKLQALERAQPAGVLGHVSVAALGRAPVGTGPSRHNPGNRPGPDSSGPPASSPTPNPGGPSSPPPSGGPTSTPAKHPAHQVVGTVKTVVTKVVGLLPKPPIPLPSKSSHSVLGGVLGQ